MKKEKKMKEVSVALNIGTGSVGYAVINSPIAGAYDIVKYKGNDAWGSILYDDGNYAQIGEDIALADEI